MLRGRHAIAGVAATAFTLLCAHLWCKFYHLKRMRSLCSADRLRAFDLFPVPPPAERMRGLFARHARDNRTVMVVQANRGFMVYLRNLLCSLRRVDPSLLQWVVVWAMDAEVDALLAQEEPALAVHYDPLLTALTPTWQPGGTDEYYDMMRKRLVLFRQVLEGLKLNLFFVDADVVFVRDPWPWVLPMAEDHTDLVYSVDGGADVVQRMAGMPRVPNVCGGLFWARASVNSRAVFRALHCTIKHDPAANDQWTMDEILNTPAYLAQVHVVRRGEASSAASGVLNIRLLDEVQFARAGMASQFWKQPAPVAFHPNSWGGDKAADLRGMGLWFLSGVNASCPAVAPLKRIISGP